jgi:hypothetical protein
MMKFKSLFLTAVFMAVSAVAMAQTAPATDAPAAKPGITPYASLRYFMGAQYNNPYVNGKSDYEDIDMRFNQVFNSRAGFMFKGDKLGGKLEAGIKDNSESNSATGSVNANLISLRHFFITYKSGDLEFLLGQTDAPFCFISTVDGCGWNGVGYGITWYARIPQLKIGYAGLYIDFQQPNNVTGPAANGVTDYTGEQAANKYDVYYPVTTVGYDYKGEFGTVGVTGTGYKFTPQATSVKDNDYLVYLATLHGHIKFDPAYVRFNVAYGQNLNRLGIDGQTGLVDSVAIARGVEFGSQYKTAAGEDNTQAEGFLEIGSKIGSGTFAIMGGGVYVITTKAQRVAAGAQYSYPLESYLKLIPTVIYMNNLKGYSAATDKTYDQGKSGYVGLMVQADI